MTETAPNAKRVWSPAQARAIGTRGQNVIVSAGAGSGKTSVLVERVVQCVLDESGPDLSNLLVVTFTEAAAAEMRRRIGEYLSARLAAASHDDPGRRRLERLLAQLEQAQISTLHSFCMQIVRQNALHLDLDPGFTVLDEEESLLVKQAVYEQVMEAALAGPARTDVQEMMARLGLTSPAAVRRLVFRLDAFSRSQASPAGWLAQTEAQYAAAADAALCDLVWYPGFQTWCEDRILASAEALATALRLAESADGLASYADNLRTAAPAAAAAARAVRAGNWDEAAAQISAALQGQPSSRSKEPVKERVQSLRKEALKRLQPVAAVIGRGVAALQADLVALAPAVAVLVRLVTAFQSAFLEAKRARGAVDFNDLEHFAYAVLRDRNTGEAERLRARFAEVFVDEFQDTSPIQDAVVTAVARPTGNVFAVGDVKQSIYRFRMADPGLFLDKYQGRSEGPAFLPIDLQDNYRSRALVVAAVNFLFSQWFSESFGGIAYDDKASMGAAAPYPDANLPFSLDGPVEVLLVERRPPTAAASEEAADEGERLDHGPALSAGDAAADDLATAVDDAGEPVTEEDLLAVEREARVVAGRIRTLMGFDGGPRHQVWDPRERAYRPLQFRDIVILLRSVKGRVTPFLDVLQEAGIPGYGVTSTGFYGALEIRWLMAALSAIDNPRREIELAALLRSPMGGFSDVDLAAIRVVQGGNFYEALEACAERTEHVHADAPADLPARCRALLQQLRSWRRLARRAGVEAVLQRVLQDTGLGAYIQAMPGGRVRTANVEVLLHRARAFDRQSVDGVYGFVHHAQQLLENEVDFGEARTLGAADDVVRVMTIHQSKGLEFPIVFVADLGKQFYRDTIERALPLHRNLGFGPHRVDIRTDQRWKTVASLAIEEAETAEFLAEEARVLYVAFTRARERLILVGSAAGLAARAEKAAWSAAMTPGDGPFPARTLLDAKTPLDWLLPALWRHPQGHGALAHALTTTGRDVPPVRVLEDAGAAFDVRLELGASVQGPAEPNEAGPTPEAVSESKPETAPASSSRPTSGDVAPSDRVEAARARLLRAAEPPVNLEEVLSSLAAAEAHLSGTDGAPNTAPLRVVPQPAIDVTAKVSATDLRRLWVARHGRGRATHRSPRAAERLLDEPAWLKRRTIGGRERGNAFHRVMQQIDLTVPVTRPAIQEAIARAVAQDPERERWLAACEPEDVLRFLASPLGQAVRRASRVLREQPFFHRITIREGGGDEFVTVQGVMDLLAEGLDRWLLVDYKTDAVSADTVAEAAVAYAAQLSVYVDAARAVIGPEKPIEAWLYFVQPAVAVPLSPVDYASLFQRPDGTR